METAAQNFGFFRRLVLPCLLISAIGIAVVAAGAALQFASISQHDASQAMAPDASAVDLGPLLWLTVGTILASSLAIAAVCYRYARRQSRLLLTALGRPMLTDAPQVAQSDDQLPRSLEAVVETLQGVQRVALGQASKDKAQLQTIIASMSDALIAVDHQQRVLLFNRAAERLFGVELSGSSNKPLWEVLPLRDVLAAVAQVSLTALPTTASVESAAGRRLEVTVSRLRESQTARGGMILVGRDVTDAARYQQLREELVANVSHELRTPLSVISGFVETLLDGALDDPPRARRYLQTLQRHAERLKCLVDDLLDLSSLSRLSADDLRSSGEHLEMDAIVRRAVELMLPAAEKKGIRLVVEPGEPVPAVSGHRDYLLRAVGNLIDNAIKYTPAGGSVRVRCTTGDGAQQVVVEVIDTGIGIAAEHLPRVFERFYRVDRSRSREMGGTGLGLAIVKHIVQAHGGSVQATSTPGAGSCFCIRLPIASAAPQPAGGGA